MQALLQSFISKFTIFFADGENAIGQLNVEVETFELCNMTVSGTCV